MDDFKDDYVDFDEWYEGDWLDCEDDDDDFYYDDSLCCYDPMYEGDRNYCACKDYFENFEEE